MKLPLRAPRRIAILVTPIADLALLLVMAVALATLSSAARGVGMRWAPAPEPGGTLRGPTIVVAVNAEGLVRVDGAEVSKDSLAREVRRRLEGAPEASVLLVVAPSAPYQVAVDAAAPLLEGGVLGGRALSIPSGAQAQAWWDDPRWSGRLP